MQEKKPITTETKVIPIKSLDAKLDINNKFRKSSRRSIKNRKEDREKELKANKEKINEQKNKFNYLYKIILLSSIFVGTLIIFLIFFFVLKKRKMPIIEKEIENISISLTNISYNEAKSLINSEKTEKNFDLLNKTIEKINNLLSFGENSSLLNEMNPNLSLSFPDFLNNPTKPALKIAKSDVELYKRKYEELILEINNFTNNFYESLKNIYHPLNNTKNEINKLLIQYKEIIINISIPFFIKSKNLHIVNTSNKNDSNVRKLELADEIEDYGKKVDKLNLIFNNEFNYFNNEVQHIENEINELSFRVRDMQNRIENDISNYRNIVGRFTDPNNIQQIHENLIDANSSFISTKSYFDEQENNVEERFNIIESEYNDRKINFDELERQKEETIENLVISSNDIKDKVININEGKKIIDITDVEISSSSMLADYIIKSLDRTVKVIKEEEIRTSESIESFVSIINVVEKTSLDLLFVMDMTGSMKDFIEDAKRNVINIINQLILECPGIDINLGFIGYREIGEEYISIEFTKEYEQLKNSIKNVYASGGQGDGPEDVAWAMEEANYKNWQNNARFLIFIADCPCHGLKYHNLNKDLYPNGAPNRRNIEELIKELAENNISLFCLKITEYTDKMFNIFSDIYKNYNKCEFQVVPMSSGGLTNVVVNSAAEVYVSQRNIDI